MKNLTLFLAVFAFLLLSWPAFSQQKKLELIDVIYLKNGSVFRGEMIAFKKGEQVTLRLRNGNEVVFKDEEVERIIQEPIGKKIRKPRKPKKPKVYAFEEKGFFNATYLSINMGKNEFENVVGIGGHNIFGYQFNRLFGAGIGVGVEYYSLEIGEVVYPLYGHVRGYLNQKINAPYYSLSAGYGFAFKNQDEFISDAEGGLYIHPSIGMRYGANKGANFVIDIGYQFQKANFTRGFDFSGDTEIRRNLFKRFTVKMGLVF